MSVWAGWRRWTLEVSRDLVTDSGLKMRIIKSRAENCQLSTEIESSAHKHGVFCEDSIWPNSQHVRRVFLNLSFPGHFRTPKQISAAF